MVAALKHASSADLHVISDETMGPNMDSGVDLRGGRYHRSWVDACGVTRFREKQSHGLCKSDASTGDADDDFSTWPEIFIDQNRRGGALLGPCEIGGIFGKSQITSFRC